MSGTDEVPGKQASNNEALRHQGVVARACRSKHTTVGHLNGVRDCVQIEVGPTFQNLPKLAHSPAFIWEVQKVHEEVDSYVGLLPTHLMDSGEIDQGFLDRELIVEGDLLHFFKKEQERRPKMIVMLLSLSHVVLTEWAIFVM